MVISDLATLLKHMDPLLSDSNFYFCTMETYPNSLQQQIYGSFREKEGWTLIFEEKDLPFNCTKSTLQALITLNVYSDLQAIGFLATISKSLAEAGISINVVSAYYHDHLFVPKEQAKIAMEILHRIQEENRTLKLQ